MRAVEAAEAASTEAEDGVTEGGLRSHGMRDLGPDQMVRFRDVERRFLEVTAARAYREIRTPTIEPLHLYTASGALSPQLLDRVYSFLDWDGWSGERVVLRPDATVAAARWFCEQGAGNGPQRLSYVQPVYRFVPNAEAGPDDGGRELWQLGVELFGMPAPEADAELLLLARDLLAVLGLERPRFQLAHAGLARAVFAAAGLSPVEQIEAFDRLVEGDSAVTGELVASYPQGAPALRLLSEVDGTTAAYVANLRSALLPVAPDAAAALDELEAAARALEDAGCEYRILAGTARNLEYYTGVTFRVATATPAGDIECLAGGRYDGLAETIGGVAAPGSGFGADLLRLAALASGAGR